MRDIGTERRIVSVLFADLVGFTTLAEGLDPEDVATLQDAYFAAVRETVTRYGGTLEKFIGDAAMAVFGAPRARDDDAERAVRAGLALVAAVEGLEARLGLPIGSLRLRVGVNTGEVVHAVNGTDAGRVTGDVVNVAARLQTAAPPGGVLVGELTALAVGEAVELEGMGALELKGKGQPVRAWRAASLRAEPSREEALGALRAPLLGRAAELDRLQQAAHRVASGGPSETLLVVAPPGAGKSRLLAELSRRLEDRGRVVLRARLRPGIEAPYDAVRQLLAAALAGRGNGDPPAALRHALTAAGAAPMRAEVVSREALALLGLGVAGSERPRAGTPVAVEREARFAAWIEALRALAGRGATWIVEDLHWAGPDLLAFVEQAGEPDDAIGTTALIVASARPSLLDAAPAWCATATRLDLPPLPSADAGELVRALVGEALPAALVAAVSERSDGNPLFVEELLRTWISVGTLVARDGGWTLTVEPREVPLPPTVQAVYAAQLDDLPADARLVARRASVAGRRFAHASLEPLELAEHRSGLDALRRRGFVIGPDREGGDDVYAYRHALLRDAGYASLARVERARLHAALGEWLAAVAGDRAAALAETIGQHFAAAHDSLPALAAAESGLDRRTLAGSAAEWLERAAEASLGLSAHEAAARLLGRAVELTPPDAELDAARRRLRRGEVIAEAADQDEGVAEMRAALDVYRAALSEDRADLPGIGRVAAALGLARAAHSLGSTLMQRLEFHTAEAVTAEALELLTGAGLSASDARQALDAGAARLLALRAWAVAAQGRSDGVREALADASQTARRLADAELELDVLERRASIHGELEDPAEAADPVVEWQAIEELALRLGRWRQAVIAMRIRGSLLADQRPAEGLEVIGAATELAEAHGMTEQLGWCQLARCETLFVIGEWAAALAAGQEAVALAERRSYVRLAYRSWLVVLIMAAELRDAALAERFADWWARSEEHFPPSPSPYGIVTRTAAQLWSARARGQEPPPPSDEVIEATRTVHSNPHYLVALESIADACLRADDSQAAERVAAHLAAACADDPAATPLMAASAALVQARTRRARGDTAGTADAARRSLAEARRIGAAWWIARAIRALREAGEADDALRAEADAIERRLSEERQGVER